MANYQTRVKFSGPETRENPTYETAALGSQRATKSATKNKGASGKRRPGAISGVDAVEIVRQIDAELKRRESLFKPL